MKKVKMIALAILAGLMCVACTPKKEKLLRAYEDACQKGDAVAVMRVVSDMEKEFGNADIDSVFTATEQQRFETASAIFEQKMAQQTLEQLGGALDAAGKATKGLYDDDDEDDDD